MSRKPAKTQPASTTKPKRNNAPTAARPASSTLADLQEQISALTRELAEAREQQTASSEVLQVISSSRGELEMVFEAILANAVRLCEAKFGTLFLHEGGAVLRSSWLMLARNCDLCTASKYGGTGLGLVISRRFSLAYDEAEVLALPCRTGRNDTTVCPQCEE
jgi:hypothetical protein